jgi:sec-independent protein translocase protein TatA
MPFDIGVPELLIVLFIIILIFGVGRLAPIGRDVGNAIRELRKGLKGDDENAESKNAETKKAEEEKKTKDS